MTEEPSYHCHETPPFSVGDRLRLLSFNEPVMTVRWCSVIGYWPETRTPIWTVSCCWFGTDMSFHTAGFDSSELRPIPEAP